MLVIVSNSFNPFSFSTFPYFGGFMGKNWIAGAIKRPGAFKAKAKEAGMSTSAYASKVLKKGSKASSRTKHQAALAKTLASMRRHKA
jgi:hypothetical protein